MEHCKRYLVCLGLAVVLALVFTARDAGAKVTLTDKPPNIVEVKKRQLISLKPWCNSGYQFNGNTCLGFGPLACGQKSGCEFSRPKERCVGSGCANVPPCPSGWHTRPIMHNGKFTCFRTHTPICPKGTYWNFNTKKCTPKSYKPRVK